MTDPISTSVIIALFKPFAGLLIKGVIEYGKEFFKSSPVQNAIKKTSAEFNDVSSLKSSLEGLVKSDSFIAMLEAQTSGGKAEASAELVESFVSDYGFFTGLLRSHDDAFKVLKRFLELLRGELYRSKDAPVYAALTEEVHHQEVISTLQDIRKLLSPSLPKTIFQVMEDVRDRIGECRLALSARSQHKE